MSDDLNNYMPVTSDNFISRALTEINSGLMIYEVDQHAEIIYSNEALWSIFECSYDAEFLQLVNGSAKGLVHPSDRNRIENIVRTQFHNKQSQYKLSHRIRTKNGKTRYIDNYTHIYNDVEKGLIGVAYIFASDNQYDSLTGLPSLSYFLDLTNSKDSSIFKDDTVPVMLSFNLNKFKSFNVKYGRSEGDSLIIFFAKILAEHFGLQNCCHNEEDRFYVFTSVKNLEKKLDSVFISLQNLNYGRSLSVRTGIFIYDPADHIFSSVACKYADIACDRNSDRQHSNYMCFDESMKDDLQKREHIFNNFNQALRHGLIEVYYQPIIYASTKKPYGFEAFARWNDPHYGMLYPDDFIPVLNQYYLTYKLDFYIIKIVAETMKELKKMERPIYPVSVNLSSTDFLMCDPCEEFMNILHEYDLSASDFQVEITEDAINHNPDKFNLEIERFHKNGFSVALEYVGSKQSSLSTFLDYDFDIIKVDRAFMRNFGERSKAIIHPIITMAKSLGIHTLAVGVETEEQASYLKQIGCELLQGFLYSRPSKLSATSEILESLNSNDDGTPQSDINGHAVYASNSTAFYKLLKDSSSYKDRIFEVLLSRYNSVHYIDLETGDYKEIIASYPVHKYLGESGHNISAAFDNVMSALAKSQYFDKLARFTNIDTIVDRLRDNEYISCDFQESLYDWNMRAAFHALSRNDNGNATRILFSTLKISSDVNSEALFTNVVQALGNVYYAVLILDIATHNVTPIIMPDMLWERAGKINSQPYEFLMNLYIESYVSTDYRDKIIHFSDLYSLPKRLDNKPFISIDYKSNTDKWRRLLNVPSKKNDNGTVTQIVVAVEDTDDEKNTQSILEYQADHDALTGLLNRAAYNSQKEHLMESASPMAYIMVDANKFKNINDTYGHDIGDKVLKVIANNLKKVFRFTDLVIRMGGDEFCVILTDFNNKDMHALIDKLNTINDNLSVSTGDYPGITISAGIALSDHGFTEQLPKMADIAMYRAKQSTNTHVVLYDESMGTTQ